MPLPARVWIDMPPFRTRRVALSRVDGIFLAARYIPVPAVPGARAHRTPTMRLARCRCAVLHTIDMAMRLTRVHPGRISPRPGRWSRGVDVACVARWTGAPCSTHRCRSSSSMRQTPTCTTWRKQTSCNSNGSSLQRNSTQRRRQRWRLQQQRCRRCTSIINNISNTRHARSKSLSIIIRSSSSSSSSSNSRSTINSNRNRSSSNSSSTHSRNCKIRCTPCSNPSCSIRGRLTRSLPACRKFNCRLRSSMRRGSARQTEALAECSWNGTEGPRNLAAWRRS